MQDCPWPLRAALFVINIREHAILPSQIPGNKEKHKVNFASFCKMKVTCIFRGKKKNIYCVIKVVIHRGGKIICTSRFSFSLILNPLTSKIHNRQHQSLLQMRLSPVTWGVLRSPQLLQAGVSLNTPILKSKAQLAGCKSVMPWSSLLSPRHQGVCLYLPCPFWTIPCPISQMPSGIRKHAWCLASALCLQHCLLRLVSFTHTTISARWAKPQ